MSRFGDGDDDWDYGRWMLWVTATQNALSGKRGQSALRDLENALLALPQHRLIEGHLAKDGEVCAIGALVLANRCAEGEDREAVLAALEEVGEDDYCADQTASIGSKYGKMAYAMAWRIAELNDEDWGGDTPEARFQGVLAWVRKAQLPTAATDDTSVSSPEVDSVG